MREDVGIVKGSGFIETFYSEGQAIRTLRLSTNPKNKKKDILTRREASYECPHFGASNFSSPHECTHAWPEPKRGVRTPRLTPFFPFKVIVRLLAPHGNIERVGQAIQPISFYPIPLRGEATPDRAKSSRPSFIAITGWKGVVSYPDFSKPLQLN